MIKLLTRSSYKAMPWKNGKGTTLEIFKYPPAATPATPATGTSAFEWRISSAMVAEDGPFSFFPGFQRSIAVLNDSLILKVNTHKSESTEATTQECMETTIDQHSAPFMFSGDDSTSGHLLKGQPVLDFNVFTDRAVCEQVVTREVSTINHGKNYRSSEVEDKSTSESTKTYCRHCFITFATPLELLHHSTQHCFPEAPEEVMARFPPQCLVADTVSGRRGIVVGPARNALKAHACVSVRSEVHRHGGSVIEADVAISRLVVRKQIQMSADNRESLVFCSIVGRVEVSTAVAKVRVEEGDSCVISNYTGDVHYTTHGEADNEGPLDLFIVKIKYSK